MPITTSKRTRPSRLWRSPADSPRPGTFTMKLCSTTTTAGLRSTKSKSVARTKKPSRSGRTTICVCALRQPICLPPPRKSSIGGRTATLAKLSTNSRLPLTRRRAVANERRLPSQLSRLTGWLRRIRRVGYRGIPQGGVRPCRAYVARKPRRHVLARLWHRTHRGSRRVRGRHCRMSKRHHHSYPTVWPFSARGAAAADECPAAYIVRAQQGLSHQSAQGFYRRWTLPIIGCLTHPPRLQNFPSHHPTTMARIHGLN